MINRHWIQNQNPIAFHKTNSTLPLKVAKLSPFELNGLLLVQEVTQLPQEFEGQIGFFRQNTQISHTDPDDRTWHSFQQGASSRSTS